MMGMSNRFFFSLCVAVVLLGAIVQGVSADNGLVTEQGISSDAENGVISPAAAHITPPDLSSGTVRPAQSPALNPSTPIRVSSEYATARVIVRYKADTMGAMAALPSVMSTANAEVGANVVADFSAAGIPEVSGMQVVKVSGIPVSDAVKEFESNPNVLYAEPDYVISLYPENPVRVAAAGETLAIAATRTPNDPEYSLQWGMRNTGQAPFYGVSGADIRVADAWSQTTGSSSVVIAVVDTGVDYSHPDLAANIWRNSREIPNNRIDDDRNGYIDDVKGWNFVAKNNDPMDDNGHGTHCAGNIAAVGNNNIGITGVCWNARIMPLKFLSSSGNGYVSDAIAAILYANRNGAQIISNSWGGSQYTQALKDAIDASPAVVVCAAGNSGRNTDTTPQYPSAYTSSNIISVAATDYKDNLAGFSNFGVSSVDLGAPGVTIRSTYRNGQYQYLSGTSMATPLVSGVAGLLKAANPGMSASAIRSRILQSADRVGALSGKVATGGRLNAARALGTPEVAPTPVVTRTPAPVTGTLRASYIAAPLLGRNPHTVQFRDISAGTPVSWTWSFGDGGFSYQKNPQHTYRKSGVYSVRLTISDGTRMSTISKNRLIRVY